MNWFKRLFSPLQSTASPQVDDTSRAERIFLKLFQLGGNTTYNDWTGNRYELAGHFKGWTYCAVHALATEIAGLQPQVARVVDQTEQEEEVKKSLRVLKSLRGTERQWYTQQLRKKSIQRRLMKTKTLAHIQQGDELEPAPNQHPLVKLLKNPNGPDVAWSFFYKVIMFLRLTGSSYIYAIPDRMGRVAELWPIPSHWVHERRGSDRLVECYEIRPASAVMPEQQTFLGGWYPGFSGRGIIEPKDMIKIAYPSPLSLTDGFAPLQAIGTWVDVSENIDKTRVSIFANHMLPGVVIEIDKEIQNPDVPTIERIQTVFAEKYAAVKNSRKPVVLAPGLRLVPAPTNEELEYHASADQARDNILAGHRTGQSMVGLSENTTYASMVASRANYYQGAVKPEVTFLGQVLTEKLAKRYGDEWCIYWPDPVPDDPDLNLRKQDQGLRTGTLTVNEARADDGREPYEFGGDDPTLPMGTQTVPWATGEPDEFMQPQQGWMPGEDSEDGQPTEDDLAALLGGDGPDGEQPEPSGIETPLAGGDGAEESEGIPSPLAKRLNGHACNGHANGNGVKHG